MTHFLYTTCANQEQALQIGRVLVENRYVACVNILENMTSIYHWEGKIVQDKEAILIAKTTEEKLAITIEKIKSLHSYEVPCIVALPIVAGNEAYLKWIQAEVR